MNISKVTTEQYGNGIRLREGTNSRNVFIQETEKSRATRFTFSFLYFLPLLPSVMDCMCGVGVVPNNKKTKTDTRKKKGAQIRTCTVLKEGKERKIRGNSESSVQRGRRRIR